MRHGSRFWRDVPNVIFLSNLQTRETMNSPITKLPDGSAFFTADVMSRDEAMNLPVEKRPLCFRISSEIYHAVFEAVGEASMCWKPTPKGVFASERASDAAVKLCFKISEELERHGWRPWGDAPQDGSEFLAWRIDAGFMMCEWRNCDEFPTLFAGNGSEDITSDLPSHWMPLPKAP